MLSTPSEGIFTSGFALEATPIPIKITVTINKTIARIYPKADANTTLKKRIW
jgi:hypothetical protein